MSDDPQSPSSAASAGAMAGAPGLEDLSPDQQQMLAALAGRVAEVQQTVLAAPASLFLQNHAMGLWELAAVHLAQSTPDLTEAALAIDGLAGLLAATQGRLGDSEPDLQAALTVIRTMFDQRSQALDGD